ncbi:MAG: endo alpha-1,4 polygalactosaminidase [Chloroflexota bacterium]
MKFLRHPHPYLILLIATAFVILLTACAPQMPAAQAEAAPTAIPTATAMATATPLPTPSPTITAYRLPPQQALWQIQYVGEIDTSLNVQIFNLDLFDTSPSTIEALHRRDVFVMCYFSAGSWEDWRPDAGRFPPEVLGKDMEGWPGEKWLDIRRIDILSPIMEARLDLAAQKGCDGVDPDNVNGYTNDTGLPLTGEDQIRYNTFLAEAAHQRGLSIGLKNDLEQIPDLVSSFDWALNEECFSHNECDLLLPFAQAKKPIFVIEYELEPSDFCPQALQMNLNALKKNWDLDAYRVDCRERTGNP